MGKQARTAAATTSNINSQYLLSVMIACWSPTFLLRLEKAKFIWRRFLPSTCPGSDVRQPPEPSHPTSKVQRGHDESTLNLRRLPPFDATALLDLPSYLAPKTAQISRCPPRQWGGLRYQVESEVKRPNTGSPDPYPNGRFLFQP